MTEKPYEIPAGPDPERIIAYRQPDTPDIPIIPASKYRQWMDQMGAALPADQYAQVAKRVYHCLPLVMANQSGWFLLNPYRFVVTWLDARQRLLIQSLEDDVPTPYLPVSHSFPGPIVTFFRLYLFRTAPGYNLLVRGPSNTFKPHIQTMEGVVEADWAYTPFPVNWVITTPNQPIIFEKYEPFAMLVPTKRREMEALEPMVANLEDYPALLDKVQRTKDARTHHRAKDFDERMKGLLHYFRGQDLDGNPAPDHQTRQNLKPFAAEWDQHIQRKRTGDDPIPQVEPTQKDE